MINCCWGAMRLLRFLSSRRRAVFDFEPLGFEKFDKSVTLKNTKDEPIEFLLEAHPIGSGGSASLVPFNEALLEDLACPITGAALKYDSERNLLVSEAAKLAFPINKAGMPIFLKKWAIPTG